MSYILDALTKSQQQRRDGDVPTLSTPQLSASSGKRGHAHSVNGALIVLAVAAVSFSAYTLVRQSDDSQPIAQAGDERAGVASRVAPPAGNTSLETATSAAPSHATDTTINAEQQAVAEPPQVVPTRASGRPATQRGQPAVSDAPQRIASSGALRNVKRARKDTARETSSAAASRAEHAPTRDASVATDSARAEQTSPRTPQRQSAAIDRIEQRLFLQPEEPVHPETSKMLDDLREMAMRPSAPPKRTVTTTDEPRLSNVIALSGSGQAPAVEPTASAAATQAPLPSPATEAVGVALPHDDRVPGLRDLPGSLQQSLGQLTINAHVYADARPERMVIINMKRYHEGDNLREGPRLDTITSTGVVLSYQAHQFRLDAR